MQKWMKHEAIFENGLGHSIVFSSCTIGFLIVDEFIGRTGRTTGPPETRLQKRLGALPDDFFGKYQRNNNFTIESFPVVKKNINSLTMEELENCIKGLDEGTMHFADKVWDADRDADRPRSSSVLSD